MPSKSSVHSKVLPGIDAFVAGGFAPLAGKRVGLLTHRAGLDAAGQRSIDVLAAPSSGVRLRTLFSPEHGLTATGEGHIPSGRDAKTGLPIHSLYGSVRRPQGKMLDGLDGIVVDLQDVGVRFYTYATTMAYTIEEAAKRKLKVVVLDRPNPIGPAGVRGPVLDIALRSFIGYFAVPVQHGMT
ncbi:MAG: exo-beta-N-acetylmuramidase NamZ domain-containing protein, partial [Hyphomicrobiaceae bacterium]